MRKFKIIFIMLNIILLSLFSATDDVKFSPGSTHIAYTTGIFPMHTDLVYKGRPPGVRTVGFIALLGKLREQTVFLSLPSKTCRKIMNLRYV